MMTTVIVLIVCGVSVMIVLRRYHRSDELGSVSGRWLSEYRQDHES